MMVRFKDDKAPCSGKWPQQRAFYLSVAVVSILGKPEPLQHDLQGFWSKKINDEHRMVYAVTETAIQIIQLKYHYHK